MSIIGLIRSELPPAPETHALRRLRHRASAMCGLSAVLVFGTHWIAALSIYAVGLVGICLVTALVLLALLAHRKSRHAETYWTDERVRRHLARVRATANRRAIGR